MHTKENKNQQRNITKLIVDTEGKVQKLKEDIINLKSDNEQKVYVLVKVHLQEMEYLEKEICLNKEKLKESEANIETIIINLRNKLEKYLHEIDQMKIKSEQEHLTLLEANQILKSEIGSLKSKEQTEQVSQKEDATTLSDGKINESNTKYNFEQEDCNTCSNMLGNIMKEFGKRQKMTKIIIFKICGESFKKNRLFIQLLARWGTQPILIINHYIIIKNLK